MRPRSDSLFHLPRPSAATKVEKISQVLLDASFYPRACFGLMENAASVEIRKKRGFPPPLGKVALNYGATFPHFPQALLVFLF